MTRSQLLILGGAASVIILAAIAYFAFFSGETQSAPASGPTGGIVLSQSDMALGSARARVKVVEYGAPTCPVCARFETDNFEQLRKNYIDTGKIYFVFRVFPINGAADGAAEGLARCAGRTSADNYFRFIDLLFRNQKEWDPEFNPPDVHAGLLRMARIAGIDADAEKCMADKANAERINEVAKDAVDRYGINATPTLVIDGVAQQPGYIPWPSLKSMMDSFVARK